MCEGGLFRCVFEKRKAAVSSGRMRGAAPGFAGLAGAVSGKNCGSGRRPASGAAFDGLAALNREICRPEGAPYAVLSFSKDIPEPWRALERAFSFKKMRYSVTDD